MEDQKKVGKKDASKCPGAGKAPKVTKASFKSWTKEPKAQKGVR